MGHPSFVTDQAARTGRFIKSSMAKNIEQKVGGGEYIYEGSC